MQKLFVSLLLAFALCVTSHAQDTAYSRDPYPFNATQDKQRFSELTNQIRCVVCQFNTIADSDAPLAADLRKRVYDMILAKNSDQEIKDYLVKRYGEQVLLKPRVNELSLLLWLGPLLGLGLAIWFIRSKVSFQAASHNIP